MKQSQKYLERSSHSWSEDSVRLILTPGQTAKSTFFHIQEIGYFKTTYPYFTERQNLNSFLLVYTISGTGRLIYQEKEYPLTAGESFYINCMDHHYYETRKGHTWEFLWVHFNGPTALGYYKEYAKNGFSPDRIADSFFMERTMRRLLAINRKRDITTEVLTSHLIVALLTELLIEKAAPHTGEKFLPQWLSAVLKDIDQHFREDLSLDLLAHRNGVNKYHLSREFKKYIGTSVNEYVIAARLSYGKELLKYSDLPVEAITYETGMHNTSHFINLFKAREGLTPLAYRKEWNH